MTPAWTTPDDVRDQLLAKWRRGQLIDAYAGGREFQPIRKALKTPAASDILNQPEAVERWIALVQKSATRGNIQLESKTVPGRRHGIGSSTIPAAITIGSFPALCRFLNTEEDVASFDATLTATKHRQAELVEWVRKHPRKAIQHAGSWDRLLGVVDWLLHNDPTTRLLRQLDVEGVDTKFVEQHRSILSDLLSVVLPSERIDDSATASQFAERFRFRPKPSYVRVRFLDPSLQLVAGYSELAVRLDELTDLGAKQIFVVENEASYLAFPDTANAVVLFGSGFATTLLHHNTWLRDSALVYWGDIDTWGFKILDSLRRVHGNVESLLMDEQTLLSHRVHWTTESRPDHTVLSALTASERAVHDALVTDQYGPTVRLEQERIRFSIVREAVAKLKSRPGDS